jgi:hypothetical protein
MALNTFTITETSAYILLTESTSGRLNYIPKQNLTIAWNPEADVNNKIILTWPSGTNRSSFDSIRLGFGMVSSPVVASDAALIAILAGFADNIVTSGGGAGGGSIVYTNAAGDFVATPGTGAKTVTITGLPFTLDYEHLIGGSIKKVVAAGGSPESVYSGTESIVISGGVITLADADDFVGTETLYVTLIGPDKWYDRNQDAAKFLDQNPDWAHYTDVEHIVDDSNATVDQHYSVPISADGYRDIAFQFTGSSAGAGVTFKIYATLNPTAATPADGDATPSLDWVDVSTPIIGAATVVLDGGASGLYFGSPSPSMPYKYIVQYEPDNVTNETDIFIRQY